MDVIIPMVPEVPDKPVAFHIGCFTSDDDFGQTIFMEGVETDGIFDDSDFALVVPEVQFRDHAMCHDFVFLLEVLKRRVLRGVSGTYWCDEERWVC